uniref:Ring finger protein 125 n=1 Tax=Chrysemys picta bellii TaxID=8478 RepID=A0A8C3I8U2_CHRPI
PAPPRRLPCKQAPSHPLPAQTFRGEAAEGLHQLGEAQVVLAGESLRLLAAQRGHQGHERVLDELLHRLHALGHLPAAGPAPLRSRSPARPPPPPAPSAPNRLTRSGRDRATRTPSATKSTPPAPQRSPRAAILSLNRDYSPIPAASATAHVMRWKYCPICRLIPGGDPSYFSRNFIRHLQLRHTFNHEDYIDINIVEEALIENILYQSFLEYMQVNHPNST